MKRQDNRIVMTLDAGGTNFVFSAICGGEEIVEPLTLPAHADRLNACLEQLLTGFETIWEQLPDKPVAISFAFPGPADYPAGIIGDLPNFPSFRGGIALGPMLKNHFGIPVFIHNDGNLFAYGEALSGALPTVNQRLREAGSTKQYRHLLGLTLGTGFGGGVVIGDELLLGDNAAGGDVWCFPNKKYPGCIAEESVSIRAVQREYADRSGDLRPLTPKMIFDIAEGTAEGDRQAAIDSFAQLGEVMGDVAASAVTLIDGIVVIGGGLSGAAKYILPAMLKEMNGTIAKRNGESFNRLQVKVYNLDDEEEFARFARGEEVEIQIPLSDQTTTYDPEKRIGVMVSKQGTSRSVALGAYWYALNHIGR